MNWKKSFVNELNKRDQREYIALESVVQYYQQILNDRTTLQIKVTKLENDLLKSQTRGLSIQDLEAESLSDDKRTQALEQQIRELTEELRKVYRLKTENEESFLRFKKQAGESEQLLAQHRQDLNALSKLNEESERKIMDLEQEKLELERARALLENMVSNLRKECEGLQADNNNVDDRVQKLTRDNKALLDEVITLKTKQMDELNEMNNYVNQVKHEKEVKRKSRLASGIGAVLDVGWWRGSPQKEAAEKLAEPLASATIDEDLSNRLRASYRMSVSVSLPYATLNTWHTDKNNQMVCSIAFDTWGTKLVAASAEKTLSVFEVNSGDELYKLRGAQGSLISCSFSHDDGLILGAGNERVIRLWSTKTQRDIRNFSGHKNKIFSAVFTYGSKHIVSGSQDRTVRLWDTNSGICINTINCKSSCNYIALSCDGDTVISAHLDSKVRIWSLKSGRQLNEYTGHNQQCNGVDISPDGSMFVSSSKDGEIHCVDLRTLEPVNIFKHKQYQNTIAWARPCFSPDNQYIVAGSGLQDDNDRYPIFIWNVKSGDLASTLSSHEAVVSFVDWHPKTGLASCDKQGIITTWV